MNVVERNSSSTLLLVLIKEFLTIVLGSLQTRAALSPQSFVHLNGGYAHSLLCVGRAVAPKRNGPPASNIQSVRREKGKWAPAKLAGSAQCPFPLTSSVCIWSFLYLSDGTGTEKVVGFMSKRKKRLRQHARRNRKKRPPAHGAALLLQTGAECPQCRGNTSATVPALGPPIYVLPAPINPPTQHTRGYAQHARIVEVTLVILLALGCTKLVIAEARSFVEEWQKWQTGPHSHASLLPPKINETSAPPAPSPSPTVQPNTTAHNATTSNGSERKKSKKSSIKRRRANRRNLCKHNS